MNTPIEKRVTDINGKFIREEIYIFNKFLETLRTLVVIKEVQIKNNL